MPSTSLNVIALISGGKDSLFSVLHCMQNGHRIIALANLYPAFKEASEGGTDVLTNQGEDTNSFMYQTVGHTIVPLHAEALNLPLYRGQITGKAANTGLYYASDGQNAPDETEDLVPLLQGIQKAHPRANALSTGAILSTYQRTRFESVAVRLGLTSLAYLWQYPALPPPEQRMDSLTGLLDDMEAAGCDARLIKICSAGIEDSLLWSRVSDPAVRNRLVMGMSRFVDGDEASLYGAVLGEGGEYETLAVNGPPRLWKKRIEVDSRSNVIVQDEGGTTRLSFGKAILAEQPPARADDESYFVRVPALLDNKFRKLGESMMRAEDGFESPLSSCDIHAWACLTLPQNTSKISSSFAPHNLTDPMHSKDVTEQTIAIIDQLDAIMQTMSRVLSVTPRIAATTILLRHMSDFAAINAIYGKRFNHINPPARVTICCGDCLPKDVLVTISFTLSQADPARISGMHVQSVSYWAPANIGPYSQAINVPAFPSKECKEQIVYLAGQIPLVPSSMHVLLGDFSDQAILSLQHLWRVGQCVGVDWFTCGVAYIADAKIPDVQRRARVAWEVWRRANTSAANKIEDADDEEVGSNSDLDPWDLKHNHQIHQPLRRFRHSANSHLHSLPNHNVLVRHPILSQNHDTTIPPFLAAHVFSLPRSAPIEWHSLGLARLPQYPTSKPHLTISTLMDERTSLSTCLQEPLDVSAADCDDELSTFTNRDRQVTQVAALNFFTIQIFAVGEPTLSSSPSLDHWLQIALSRLKQQHERLEDGMSWKWGNLTIYICSQAGYDAIATAGLAGTGTLIPCRSLWGQDGRRVEVAIVGRRELMAAAAGEEGGRG